MTSWSIVSQSPAMTRRLGALVGTALESGTAVALIGALGAGKTELVQGLAQGLGVSEEEHVTSPTYSIINPYLGRFPVYHLDLYRLGDEHELEELGFSELLSTGGVLLVEWADRFLGLLPDNTLVIRLDHRSPRTRTIRLSPLERNLANIAPIAELILLLAPQLNTLQTPHKHRRST